VAGDLRGILAGNLGDDAVMRRDLWWFSLICIALVSGFGIGASVQHEKDTATLPDLTDKHIGPITFDSQGSLRPVQLDQDALMDAECRRLSPEAIEQIVKAVRP